MPSLARPIRITKGSTVTLELTVKSEAGVAQDLTGARIVFAAKARASDSTAALISKDSAVGITEVEITDFAGGIARVYLLPADTSGLTPGRFEYDVWLVTASGERYVVVPVSVMTLLASVVAL